MSFITPYVFKKMKSFLKKLFNKSLHLFIMALFSVLIFNCAKKSNTSETNTSKTDTIKLQSSFKFCPYYKYYNSKYSITGVNCICISENININKYVFNYLENDNLDSISLEFSFNKPISKNFCKNMKEQIKRYLGKKVEIECDSENEYKQLSIIIPPKNISQFEKKPLEFFLRDENKNLIGKFSCRFLETSSLKNESKLLKDVKLYNFMNIYSYFTVEKNHFSQKLIKVTDDIIKYDSETELEQKEFGKQLNNPKNKRFLTNLTLEYQFNDYLTEESCKDIVNQIRLQLPVEAFSIKIICENKRSSAYLTIEIPANIVSQFEEKLFEFSLKDEENNPIRLENNKYINKFSYKIVPMDLEI